MATRKRFAPTESTTLKAIEFVRKAGLRISNAAKYVELNALRQGKSVAEAARARQQVQMEAEFAAKEMAAGTWAEKMLVRGQRALAEQGLEIDAQLDAARGAAREAAKNGSKKKTGSKGRGKKEFTVDDLLESAERDLTNLERQFELLGKNTEEAAKLKAQWSMLDAAKKAGIPITAELNAQIEAHASQVGRLTAELEKAEIAQQQFDQAIDGIADAFAGALVAGESLREGLGQVLKSIASDIINSGIRNALLSQFGGGGGLFGGLVQSFLGGGDRLTGALRVAGLPARASGGPVTAGQMYMTGERGPEPFVPAVDGRILSVSQAQAALRGGAQSGGGSMHIHVTAAFDESGNLYVKDVAEQAAMSMGAQINNALPARVQQINANPRRR